MSLLDHVPTFSSAAAEELADRVYGVSGSARSLPSERDQNFHLVADSGAEFVLKIANATETRSLLEAQNLALAHLVGHSCPQLVLSKDGDSIVETRASDGRVHLVRLVTYLPGTPLGEVQKYSVELLNDLGRTLGRMDHALSSLDHPAFHRDFHWDLVHGPKVTETYGELIEDLQLGALVVEINQQFIEQVTPLLPRLQRSIIHGDANDYNILVDSDRISGIVDFGDMVHSFTVGELAVATAYVLLRSDDPIESVKALLHGYCSEFSLTPDELEVFWPFVLMRLCMSVSLAAYQRRQQPENEYLGISQQAIHEKLPKLAQLDWSQMNSLCVSAVRVATRHRLLGHNLSIAYRKPVTIVRGEMQYLYDDTGRKFLDAYNNVAHVGHCHPRVVAAGQRQMSILNTNTRYLHDYILNYAEQLLAKLPSRLSVCYFVNSGSEANELALRLARAHTNAKDLIVLDHAYHGNTTTLIDISPYKHNGPGGKGAPPWVHTAPLPDRYRGDLDFTLPVVKLVDELGSSLCGFIAESLPSVGGQIVLPENYLATLYESVRRAGGVCIADEVQTGLGRIGSHYWGFELYGVEPDIVVLGKPIGNGHPIGAVITTRAIADSFANGMEFFSTFGGNAVSCAIGMEVLRVVDEEELQTHAHKVGARLLSGLHELQRQYELIGDVRGMGLFLGVELVKSRESKEPATEVAHEIVNQMRDAGILLGTDGPFHNVIKIRPPMPFSPADADHLIDVLSHAASLR